MKVDETFTFRAESTGSIDASGTSRTAWEASVHNQSKSELHWGSADAPSNEVRVYQRSDAVYVTILGLEDDAAAILYGPPLEGAVLQAYREHMLEVVLPAVAHRTHGASRTL